MTFDSQTALLVVDQQLDFQPGGALAVAGGDAIVEPIVRLMDRFENIIFTQDSHPAGHISFASSYDGKQPFQTLSLSEVQSGKIRSKFSNEVLIQYLQKVPDGVQVLWPDHCVIGTPGWAFDPRLPAEKAHLILQKGTKIDCDSYSAFFENDGSSTGLIAYLKDQKIKRLVIVGLAGDYCVFWSARDAIRQGFQVIAPSDLTRYVNFPAGSREAALGEIRGLGAENVFASPF